MDFYEAHLSADRAMKGNLKELALEIHKGLDDWEPITEKLVGDLLGAVGFMVNDKFLNARLQIDSSYKEAMQLPFIRIIC